MPSTTTTLSTTMQLALRDLAGATDHRVRAVGGGYWLVDGRRVAWTTHTVYAMADRGLLQRMHAEPESWRDTYELTALGLDAARALDGGTP